MAFYGAIEQVLTGWIFGLLEEGDDAYEQAKGHIVETICGGLVRIDSARHERQRSRKASGLVRPARGHRGPGLDRDDPRCSCGIPPHLWGRSARVKDDDPQRTQEWDPRPGFEDRPEVAAATAAEAEASAAAREAEAQAARAEAEARGAELRQELHETDARRAEEETAKAHDEAEAADREEEKLSRKERKAKERAEQAAAEAEQARKHAAEAERLRRETAQTAPAPNLSGAHVMSPGLGSDTDPSAAASAASSYTPPTARRRAERARAPRGPGRDRVRERVRDRPHPQATGRLSHGRPSDIGYGQGRPGGL